MTRTVISQADLEDKAREIVERVRHGELAVVESSGEEQIVLLDAADFRLLQALAACATESPEPNVEISRDARVLRRYLNSEINLGKAAEELGLSRLELQDRFHRLGVPLRIGPESLEDAQREIAAVRKLRRERSQRVESQALLDSLNRVYEDGPTPEEKLVQQLMKQKHRELVKGDW